MKNIREKFKKNVNFVKPLYKKVKIKSKNDNDVPIEVEIVNDLEDKNKPKKQFIKDNSASCSYILVKNKTIRNFVISSSAAKRVSNFESDKNIAQKSVFKTKNPRIRVPIVANNTVTHGKLDKINEDFKINNYMKIESWLRVFPAPKKNGESIYVTMFRYVVSQVGIATFLTIWTLLWVMVIHYFEGPNEVAESTKFLKQQNQIIIDLATELRQVAPMSQKWRQVIETRISEEGQLAIKGVEKGVIRQGQYWNVPGTFLCLVYVITTLGYGAKMPLTTYGKISTFIFASFGIPLHVYLIINSSACLTARIEIFMKRCAGLRKVTLENESECNTKSKLRENAVRVLKMACAGRCIPLVMLLYYFGGVIAFGVTISPTTMSGVFAFPLNFTVSGGLAEVPNHRRILYALYLEVGVFILACALATARRLYSDALQNLCNKYGLYHSEACIR